MGRLLLFAGIAFAICAFLLKPVEIKKYISETPVADEHKEVRELNEKWKKMFPPIVYKGD